MSTHEFDGPAAAVQHATNGAGSWRSAAHAQQSATPDHSDWYAITGEITDTLRCLATLASVFAQQINAYGDGRVLRDDAGADPAVRLVDARAFAYELRAHLDAADYVANRFWSEISHIAVEVSR